jgi:hypothetical protein
MYDRSSMITVSIFFLSFLHFNSFSLGFHQQSLSVLRARYLLISSRCGTRLSFFKARSCTTTRCSRGWGRVHAFSGISPLGTPFLIAWAGCALWSGLREEERSTCDPVPSWER